MWTAVLRTVFLKGKQRKRGILGGYGIKGGFFVLCVCVYFLKMGDINCSYTDRNDPLEREKFV